MNEIKIPSIEFVRLKKGITEEEFVECYQIVRNACEHAVQKNLQHLSYFEFLFAMAAVYFSKLELDYVITRPDLAADWMRPMCLCRC